MPAPLPHTPQILIGSPLRPPHGSAPSRPHCERSVFGMWEKSPKTVPPRCLFLPGSAPPLSAHKAFPIAEHTALRCLPSSRASAPSCSVPSCHSGPFPALSLRYPKFPSGMEPWGGSVGGAQHPWGPAPTSSAALGSRGVRDAAVPLHHHPTPMGLGMRWRSKGVSHHLLPSPGVMGMQGGCKPWPHK